MKLSEFDRINAIILASNALIVMIEQEQGFKPFTFPNIKDLAKRLVRSIEYNSNQLYKQNDSEHVTEYAINMQNLCQDLIHTACIVNFYFERDKAVAFQKEFYDLLNKYEIEI